LAVLRTGWTSRRQPMHRVKVTRHSQAIQRREYAGLLVGGGVAQGSQKRESPLVRRASVTALLIYERYASRASFVHMDSSTLPSSAGARLARMVSRRW
jgi:hypothetical protein